MPTGDHQRSRSGDLHGEGAEYLRGELLRFLIPRTGDLALAEDLVQDTFVHVLPGRSAIRDGQRGA